MTFTLGSNGLYGISYGWQEAYLLSHIKLKAWYKHTRSFPSMLLVSIQLLSSMSHSIHGGLFHSHPCTPFRFSIKNVIPHSWIMAIKLLNGYYLPQWRIAKKKKNSGLSKKPEWIKCLFVKTYCQSIIWVMAWLALFDATQMWRFVARFEGQVSSMVYFGWMAPKIHNIHNKSGKECT